MRWSDGLNIGVSLSGDQCIKRETLTISILGDSYRDRGKVIISTTCVCLRLQYIGNLLGLSPVVQDKDTSNSL